MKKVFGAMLLIPILAALVIQAGCESVGSSDKPVYIVIGIDRTSSTDIMVAKYREYSKQLLQNLRANTSGVTIMADMISDRPLTKSDFIVNKEIQAKQFSELDWQYQDRTDNAFNQLSSGFEELLTRPVNFKGTHVMDFVALGAEVMTKNTNSSRQIWLFTDGFEENDNYNFASEGKQLTADRIQEILNGEKAAGRLPDLTGIDLIIIGAGAGDYADESTDVYSNVRAFWQAYAKITNARLCSYGPALADVSSCTN